jgi:hypothetical protein
VGVNGVADRFLLQGGEEARGARVLASFERAPERSMCCRTEQKKGVRRSACARGKEKDQSRAAG